MSEKSLKIPENSSKKPPFGVIFGEKASILYLKIAILAPPRALNCTPNPPTAPQGVLQGRFWSRRGRFGSLRDRFWSLRGRFWSLRDRFSSLRDRFSSLRALIWVPFHLSGQLRLTPQILKKAQKSPCFRSSFHGFSSLRFRLSQRSGRLHSGVPSGNSSTCAK